MNKHKIEHPDASYVLGRLKAYDGHKDDVYYLDKTIKITTIILAIFALSGGVLEFLYVFDIAFITLAVLFEIFYNKQIVGQNKMSYQYSYADDIVVKVYYFLKKGAILRVIFCTIGYGVADGSFAFFTHYDNVIPTALLVMSLFIFYVLYIFKFNSFTSISRYNDIVKELLRDNYTFDSAFNIARERIANDNAMLAVDNYLRTEDVDEVDKDDEDCEATNNNKVVKLSRRRERM